MFESCQSMNDIPYGDCFTVDKRWDIKSNPDDPHGIKIEVYLTVPFSRSCFFKKV